MTWWIASEDIMLGKHFGFFESQGHMVTYGQWGYAPRRTRGKLCSAHFLDILASFGGLDTHWLRWKVFCVLPTLETKYFVGVGPRRYRPSIQKQALFGLEKDFVCPRLETVGIKKKTKQSGSCQPTGSHYEFWNAVPMDSDLNLPYT